MIISNVQWQAYHYMLCLKRGLEATIYSEHLRHSKCIPDCMALCYRRWTETLQGSNCCHQITSNSLSDDSNQSLAMSPLDGVCCFHLAKRAIEDYYCYCLLSSCSLQGCCFLCPRLQCEQIAGVFGNSGQYWRKYGQGGVNTGIESYSIFRTDCYHLDQGSTQTFTLHEPSLVQYIKPCLACFPPNRVSQVIHRTAGL